MSVFKGAMLVQFAGSARTPHHGRVHVANGNRKLAHHTRSGGVEADDVSVVPAWPARNVERYWCGRHPNGAVAVILHNGGNLPVTRTLAHTSEYHA